MGNPRLQTRVNKDTLDRVEGYEERHGHPNTSAAVRDLIVKGIEAEEGGSNADRPWTEDFLTTSGAVIAVASILALLLHLFTTLLTSWELVLSLGVLTAAFNAAAIRSRNR